ncbi:MAG: hypothetical protein HY719_00800 [Planctomycetes bacterium]|nr:hypothetical protein [Planctomycetota bacterium]
MITAACYYAGRRAGLLFPLAVAGEEVDVWLFLLHPLPGLAAALAVYHRYRQGFDPAPFHRVALRRVVVFLALFWLLVKTPAAVAATVGGQGMAVALSVTLLSGFATMATSLLASTVLCYFAITLFEHALTLPPPVTPPPGDTQSPDPGSDPAASAASSR